MRQGDDTLGCRGLALILLGIAFIIGSVGAGVTDLRYASSGKTATATVTYAWQEATKYSLIPLCYYRFTVAGKSYEGKDGNHQPDEQIQIQYLEGDPKQNRIVGERAWMPLGLVALILAPVAIGIGAVMMKKGDDLMTD